MKNNSAPEPLIEYPCQWEYRVIGKDETSLKKALGDCLGERLCEVAPGNTSAGGKYLSFQVTVTVSDRETRDRIYQKLSAHVAVTMVL